MRREGIAIGLFFVAAGVLFLLDALEVLTVRATYLWPLLLIGFGIALIAGGRRRPEPAPAATDREAGEAAGEEAPPETIRQDENRAADEAGDAESADDEDAGPSDSEEEKHPG